MTTSQATSAKLSLAAGPASAIGNLLPGLPLGSTGAIHRGSRIGLNLRGW